ncbi:MAG TPA: hypothetical protein VGR07_23945, partial [Thermoanaerobaculia bacterium]|nr:hypothetical protein [Thermoanaerobaculia bacterium]
MGSLAGMLAVVASSLAVIASSLAVIANSLAVIASSLAVVASSLAVVARQPGGRRQATWWSSPAGRRSSPGRRKRPVFLPPL